jgi:hypothetical protein
MIMIIEKHYLLLLTEKMPIFGATIITLLKQQKKHKKNKNKILGVTYISYMR